MTDRERQRQLDLLAMQFIDALETQDFHTIDRLWTISASDPELQAMLIDTASELAHTHELEAQARVEGAVVEAVERHMPSAEVIRPVTGPLTVGEVAEFIRRHQPANLTTDEIAANEQLRRSAEVVPAQLGLSQVLAWGRQFGSLPDSYWRAFRQTAIKLRMRRDSELTLQMAARASKPRTS